MKKSILIIGGTGFLGQSFFDYINTTKSTANKLSKIIIISRKKKKIKSKITTSYIRKNITDITEIPLTDYIIYAANSDDSKENLKGFYNFKKLLNEKYKKTKILFTSSGAVYGPKKIKKKIKEKDLVNFNNVSKFSGYKKNYAKSKIIIENEFKKLGKKGFNVSIARLFSFIGKKILNNNHFAITNLINQSKDKKTEKILIKSKAEVFRGYMNSEDLIRWILKILDNSNKNCNIYNVGSNEAISIEQLAKIIGKKFSKSIDFVQEDISKNKRQNIDFYVPSIAKAKKQLNLNLRYNIKQSLNQLLT